MAAWERLPHTGSRQRLQPGASKVIVTPRNVISQISAWPGLTSRQGPMLPPASGRWLDQPTKSSECSDTG